MGVGQNFGLDEQGNKEESGDDDDSGSADEIDPERQNRNAHFRTLLSMKAVELHSIKPVMEKCSNRIWTALIECEQELREHYEDRTNLISTLPSTRGSGNIGQDHSASFESVDLAADTEDPRTGPNPSVTALFEDFWLSVLCNHPKLRSHIEDWDKPVMKYLNDVQFETDVKNAFKIKRLRLILSFDTNPYFLDTSLVKTFYITTASNPYLPDIYGEIRSIKSVGTLINWYPGKNVTADGTGQVRESLFNYFMDFENPLRDDVKAQQTVFRDQVEELKLALIVRQILPVAISRFIQQGDPVVSDDAESTVADDNESVGMVGQSGLAASGDDHHQMLPPTPLPSYAVPPTLENYFDHHHHGYVTVENGNNRGAGNEAQLPVPPTTHLPSQVPVDPATLSQQIQAANEARSGHTPPNPGPAESESGRVVKNTTTPEGFASGANSNSGGEEDGVGDGGRRRVRKEIRALRKEPKDILNEDLATLNAKGDEARMIRDQIIAENDPSSPVKDQETASWASVSTSGAE